MADWAVAVKDELGTVNISEEVIAAIAGATVSEISGITTVSPGIMGGITERLGVKSLSRGIKVELSENQCTVNVYLAVDYGIRIPEVAERCQVMVKRAIENMTQIQVTAVNIHVQGVTFKVDSTTE